MWRDSDWRRRSILFFDVLIYFKSVTSDTGALDHYIWYTARARVPHATVGVFAKSKGVARGTADATIQSTAVIIETAIFEALLGLAVQCCEIAG